jgi:hypothetical protein
MALWALALVLLAVPAEAQRRLVNDTVESGTHHSVWRGTDKCVVVTSSLDGSPVITGTYQYRCNWDGVDPDPVRAPFGHSHTEQFFLDGDLAWTSEYFFRFRYRHDTNVDVAEGSKFFRPSYGSAGAWVVACEFQGGDSGTWVWFEGLISVSYFSPGNSQGNPTVVCGDHVEHELEYYVYKHATNGVIKFWQDGVLHRTWTGDTSNIILTINMLSNWSLNPGWDHDALNSVYVDDFEIYTDATSGGESATGSMADGTVTVGGAATVPDAPTIGAVTAGNGQCTVAFSPPASDGGATITGYTATSTPGSFTGTAASSPITVSGLSNGAGYTFTVYATNSEGNSSNSSASGTCTPAVSTAPVRVRLRGGE